jgi:hypothetical protein
MVISRYMTFERFVDVCEKGLYLPPANYYLKNDPWEGLTIFHWKQIAEQIDTQSLKVFNRKQIEMGNEMITDVDTTVLTPITGRGRINDALTHIFVSCWHNSTEESIAMWKLYSNDTCGVCIETDIDKLKAMFEDLWKFHNRKLFIMARNVTYINPRGPTPSEVEQATFSFVDPNGRYNSNPSHHFALGGLSLKHSALSFEKEFRVICDSFMLSNSSLLCEREPNKEIRAQLPKGFIRRVVVCPGMKNNRKDEVAGVLKDNGIRCPVERSVFDLESFQW